MRLRGKDGQTLWLGYGMNVHPGGEAQATMEAVRTTVVPLKARLGVDGPFGLAVRWSAAGCRQLLSEPAVFDAFVALLQAYDLRVFTGNAFVHGDFHGRALKDEVYRPDWGDDARGDYTVQFAEVLGRLGKAGLGPDGPMSLSTSPLSWKGWAQDEDDRVRQREQLIRVAVGLWGVERAYGQRVELALEPEPGCSIETTPELLAAFAALRAQAEQMRSDGSLGRVEAESFLGACYDVCHQAVAWEDAEASLHAIHAAGIGIGKLQASCALELADPHDDGGRAALARFDEPVYLHQVGARDDDGTLHMASDLPAVLDDPAWRARGPWRSHFHVPVFRDVLVGGLRTTRPELERALRAAVRAGLTRHIEVETYTWDVLPEAEKEAGSGFDLVDALEHELRWVLGVLAEEGVHPMDAPGGGDA